jgi:hypothetical protein
MTKLLLTSIFLFFTILTFAKKSEVGDPEKYLQLNKSTKQFNFNKGLHNPSLIEINSGNKSVVSPANLVYFEYTNVYEIAEKAAGAGCDVFSTVEVKVTGRNINSPQTITLDYSSSTATIDEDYSTDTASLTFDKDGTKIITLKIYNDGIIEDTESIVIKFDVNTTDPVQNRIANYVITDDDYVPTIGITTVEVLREEFESSDMPVGWEARSILETEPNVWLFDGQTPDTFGKAYISSSIVSNGATYDSTAGGNLLLLSDLINAKGFADITISFDWQAGGETDQVDSESYFDYGTFVYSYDGINFTSMANFAGAASGAAPSSGNYNKAIAALDDAQFYLGWRWINDDLLGTSFSFTIDNVLITGTPASVATVLAQSETKRVKTGSQIYFLDAKDGDVIGMINNAIEDLNCVTLTVSETGNEADFTNIAGTHSGKIIKVETDVTTASYDLTLFFTDSEVNQLSGDNLSVIKVNSNSIDDASTTSNNFQKSTPETMVYAEHEYSTYKGTYTGSATYALMVQETLSARSVTSDEFRIYPTVLSADKSINIIGNKTVIDHVDIYAINGTLISSLELESRNQAKIAVSKLTSGMYFLVINDNRTDSFKFLIK